MSAVPSFSPEQVRVSHAESMRDGTLHSVGPEVTGLDIDTDALRAASEAIGVKDLHVSGSVQIGNRSISVTQNANLLSGVMIEFCNGDADICMPCDATRALSSAAETVAEQVLPIDQYFRAWYGIGSDQPTRPRVSLIAGRYRLRNSAATYRHLDFDGLFPLVSFKSLFWGEHGSEYFLNDYLIPRGIDRALRVSGRRPINQPLPFHARTPSVSMPPREVCVEPWNAYHAGPSDPRSNRTTRGILDVYYRLDEIADAA